MHLQVLNYFMQKIRIISHKTSLQWEKIDKIIQLKKKKSISAFITTEVSRLYRPGEKCECTEERLKRTKKYFSITVQDDLYAVISCQANAAGLSPGEFIDKIILDAIA